MNKHINFTYLSILILASLTACESNETPIQHADNYNYITFSAQTEKITRANPYEAYDPTKHPVQMGVFGYHDISTYDALTRAGSTPAANPIFDNEMVNYNTSSKNWESISHQLWDSYKGATTFDFFGYMPRTEAAELTRTAMDTYTLSIPFSMPAADHLLFDTKQAPIICALPEHKEGTSAEGDQFTFEREVKLQFDQTLTAYRLLFKLDPKMGAIRQFRIKGVNLTGDIATSGTINRTYHWANRAWKADDIKWTNITKESFADTPIPIPYQAASSTTSDGSQTTVITSADFTQWGPVCYMIPDTKFEPTISVTYDVELIAEDGSTVITRKDVTSAITLNKNNFSGLTTGKTAMIYPIRILIQPRYLYVLGDDDAYTGHLLID